jgi:oligoribonuclease NrnB/cAMP/cGMP phosphodiesterase (DHH superfamily)
MVDFSYKRPVIEEMAKQAQSILILDHHKSAAEDLAGFQAPPNFVGEDLSGWLPDEGIYAQFDLNHSGAWLAWKHFHAAPHPRLIEHIEDRDLWRFSLPKTRDIQAAVFSYPYDFDVWTRLMEENPDVLATEGAAIERKHHKDIAELVQVVTRKMRIGGHMVPIANLPYTLASDAGHLLCGSDFPFAGCYWDTPEGRVFSLRSKEDGFDVSEIAKQYGGGGHKHAAGFRVSWGHELTQ